MPASKKLTKATRRYCKYTFTPDEIQQLGRELADHTSNLSAIEDDKKRVTSDFAAKIKAAEADISIATNKIKSGYEHREMPCTVTFDDPVQGRKTSRRDDNKEIVAVEDMTPAELQQEMELEGE